jgi:hypothetical protein
MKGNSPVVEKIDERILRILGLLEIFDFDYDTYRILLKEKLIEVSTFKAKIPIEEIELLRDELRRVRIKTGRISPRIKKNNSLSSSPIKSFSQKLLPGKGNNNNKSESNTPTISTSILNSVEKIRSTVDGIYKTIQIQSNLDRKQIDVSRKESEKEARIAEEQRLETSKNPILEKVKKIFTPFESIFDQILRFLVFTILGRAFKLFMDWTSNPENRKKLESIGRFLKDWWPALLGAWFFFANPLGSFIRTIVGTVAKLTFKLAKFAIPKLLKFVAANPIAAKAVAAAAVIGGGAYLATKVTGQQEAAPIQAENKAKAQRGKSLDIRGTDTPIDKSPSVGDMGPSTPFGLLQGVNTGGIIKPLIQGVSNGGSVFSGLVDKDTGETVSGAGPDTQYLPVEGGGGAVLQRGESVLQVGARERMIQQVGVDPLAYNIGSNANKPKKIDADTLASSGGLIGLSNGGQIGESDKKYAITPKVNMSPSFSTMGSPKVNMSPSFSTMGSPKVNMSPSSNNFVVDRSMNTNDHDTSLFNLYQKNIQFDGKDKGTHNIKREYDGTKNKLINISVFKSISNFLSHQIPKNRNYMDSEKGTYDNSLGTSSILGGLLDKEGKVLQSTGIRNPHSANDTRLVPLALNPNEYVKVFTKDFVDNGGIEFVRILQAKLDSDSNDSKNGILSNSPLMKYIPEPPQQQKNTNIDTITLPPIIRSSRPKGGVNGGSNAPNFSVVSGVAAQIRISNAELLGIV